MGKASRRRREARLWKEMDSMCGSSTMICTVFIDKKWKIYGCPPGGSHAKCIGICENENDVANVVNELRDVIRTIDYAAWDDEKKRVLDLDKWDWYSDNEWDDTLPKELAQFENDCQGAYYLENDSLEAYYFKF